MASGPLMAAAPRLLRQGADDVPGVPFQGDNFGFSLASSVWWGHGLPDLSYNLTYLAIGAPGVTAGNAGGQGRGEVVVLYPYPGINQLWHQVVGVAEPGDWFGYSLASGRFGLNDPDATWHQGPLHEGLAIGVPGEDVNGANDAGAVEVLYLSEANGLPRRLHWSHALLLTQEKLGEPTQGGTLFGFSLAAGGLTGRTFSERFDELVIGEPLRDVGFGKAAGAVHVLRSAYDVGLDKAPVLTITQGGWVQGWPLPSTSEDNDWFGFSVEIGSDDVLAIGAPGENDFTGSVHVLRGGDAGLTSTGAQVLVAPSGLRQFGWSVDVWSTRLLVGAPRTNDDAGSVAVFHRNGAGPFVATGTLTQDSIFGLAQPSEPGDGFGTSVGAGGFPRMTFTW